MTRTDLINELNVRGYEAEAKDTIKNGVTFEGILIKSKDSNISPLIYTDEILENNTDISTAVDELLEIYQANLVGDDGKFAHVTSNIDNPDWILSHIRIALQKKSEEAIVKVDTEFDGIEKYLLCIDDGYSFKVTPDILMVHNIGEHNAWVCAEKNTFDKVFKKNLGELIGEMLGTDEYEEMPQEVLSNTERVKGASAILDLNIRKELANKYGTNKLVMLPSSIHEVIVLPYDSNTDKSEYDEMVKSVNETQVAPEDRLSDVAYIIDVA